MLTYIGAKKFNRSLVTYHLRLLRRLRRVRQTPGLIPNWTVSFVVMVMAMAIRFRLHSIPFRIAAFLSNTVLMNLLSFDMQRIRHINKGLAL